MEIGVRTAPTTRPYAGSLLIPGRGVRQMNGKLWVEICRSAIDSRAAAKRLPPDIGTGRLAPFRSWLRLAESGRAVLPL